LEAGERFKLQRLCLLTNPKSPLPIVRDLKAKKGESQEEIEELEKAVKELLGLKQDLASEV